ncbi:MAG: hypothetical protein R2813_04520 [Flavobacteriales bacterium]
MVLIDGPCRDTSAALVINSNSLLIATLSNWTDTCENAGAVPLNGGAPAGSYFGPAIVNDTLFTQLVAGASTSIGYYVTDSNGCSDSTSQTIYFNAAPSVLLVTGLGTICTGDSITLSGGIPAGGVFSGSIVSNGVAYATIQDTGTQEIYYSYTNSNGCTSTDTNLITVAEKPAISFNFPPNSVCNNASPIPITGYSPAGGIICQGRALRSTFFFLKS